MQNVVKERCYGVDIPRTKAFFRQPMNLITITDGVIVFCIALAITIFEAIQELLTIFQKGIFVNQRDILLKKTNRELKAMLTGMKKISKLNKNQLVDLVILNA